jgi:TRAP-type C4-dicarboxylate transport system permease small subunit
VERLVDVYFKFLKLLIVMSLAAMVVLVFGNVVLRYAFNSGIAQAEELSRWLFVWLVFLGSITALRRGAHLGMDSLVSRLSFRGKQVCFAASHVLMLITVVLFFIGTWTQVQLNYPTKAPATGLSMSILYAAALPFCLTAAALLLANLWRLAHGGLREDELIGVSESEEHAASSAPSAGSRP